MVDRSLLESKSDFYALGSGLAYLAEAFAAADAGAQVTLVAGPVA